MFIDTFLVKKSIKVVVRCIYGGIIFIPPLNLHLQRIDFTKLSHLNTEITSKRTNSPLQLTLLNKIVLCWFSYKTINTFDQTVVQTDAQFIG